jgi:hypothetical protein
MATPPFGRADLCALREFLREHYQPGNEGFYLPGQRVSIKPIFDQNNFTVTYVNQEEDAYHFMVRRVRFVKFYDVVKFTCSHGAISAQAGQPQDDYDREMIKDVHDTLSKKTYNQMVSNLDDLILKE